MDKARDRAFDVIIVEDRLAVHEGVVTTALVGLCGLVGQLHREDNARCWHESAMQRER